MLVYKVWVGNVKSVKYVNNSLIIETDTCVYRIVVRDQHVEVYFTDNSN